MFLMETYRKSLVIEDYKSILLCKQGWNDCLDIWDHCSWDWIGVWSEFILFSYYDMIILYFRCPSYITKSLLMLLWPVRITSKLGHTRYSSAHAVQYSNIHHNPLISPTWVITSTLWYGASSKGLPASECSRSLIFTHILQVWHPNLWTWMNGWGGGWGWVVRGGQHTGAVRHRTACAALIYLSHYLLYIYITYMYILYVLAYMFHR